MSHGSRHELTERISAGLTRRQITPFVDFALRTRSPLARAVVCHRALGKYALGMDDRNHDLDNLESASLDLLWGSAWGKLTALWDTDEDRLERAAAIFDALLDRHPARSLPQDAAACYAQVLLRLGRDRTLQTLLPTLELTDVDRWCLRTDLANPWRHGLDTDEASSDRIRAWCDVFNEILDSKLSQVRVLEGQSSDSDGPAEGITCFGVTPYQRLAAPTAASAHTPRTGRDLVTVVMSAFRPGPDLHTAVRSVLAQTWSDLELIIVDDCSGPGYHDLIQDVAAQDPRIKILTAEVNAGTYAARNLALHHAQGRYVTFQDSDDWTHPQRIEAQLEPLLTEPGVLATRSRALRAYPDLTMTYVGYSPERLNASSLLFEREPVVAAIGGFDETRKSADMEFPLRLRAVRPGSVRDLSHPTPLAITQLRADSLSRSDAVPGWIRWDRIHYRDAYLEWHQQFKHGRSLAIAEPHGTRAFPLPNPAWSLDRTTPTSRAFDVVVLSDFRGSHPRSVLSNGIVELGYSAGLNVGVATRELPEPLSTRRPAFSRQTQRTVSERRATLTHVDSSDTTRVLLVTEPAVLLHLAGRPTLSCHELWVYVGMDDVSVCPLIEPEVKRHFGLSPLWIPNSAAVRDRLIDRWGTHRVYPDVVPMGVAVDLLQVTGAKRAFGDPLIIGNHLPDGATYWPEGRQVIQAYPTRVESLVPNLLGGAWSGTQVDVRMLAGVATGTRALRLELPPPGWCSMAGLGMSKREFLSHLDVFVYQGAWNTAAQVAALEAISAGLPTVLPLAAQDALGRASTYATPAGVGRALARFVAEPEFGRDLVRAGRKFVQCSSEPWVSLFSALPMVRHHATIEKG